MAEHKKTAGAKAPAKRKNAAKAAGGSETVTSKAPVRAKKVSSELKKDAAPRQSKAGKPQATGAGNTDPKAAARKGGSRRSASPAAHALVERPVAVGSTVAAISKLSDAKPIAAAAEASLQAGTERVLQAYGHVTAPTATLRNAVTESTTAATSTVLEVNGKVFEAVRAQSDAAFELWRSTLAAGSLSEAVRVQTSGARQAYETAANHWKDMAETTTRWFAAAMKPLQSALTDRRR